MPPDEKIDPALPDRQTTTTFAERTRPLSEIKRRNPSRFLASTAARPPSDIKTKKSSQIFLARKPVRPPFETKTDSTMCRRLRINLYCHSVAHDKIPFGRLAEDLTEKEKDYLKQTLVFSREGIAPCDDYMCQGSVSSDGNDDIQVLFHSGHCNDCRQKKARDMTGPRWLDPKGRRFKENCQCVMEIELSKIEKFLAVPPTTTLPRWAQLADIRRQTRVCKDGQILDLDYIMEQLRSMNLPEVYMYKDGIIVYHGVKGNINAPSGERGRFHMF